MNKRHPVELVHTLQTRLEMKQEGLWYATVSPEGQIRELKRLKTGDFPDLFAQWVYFRSAIEDEDDSLIIVRKGQDTHQFDEWDWFFIEKVTSKAYLSERVFDYIKIFTHKASLLSDYEFL